MDPINVEYTEETGVVKLQKYNSIKKQTQISNDEKISNCISSEAGQILFSNATCWATLQFKSKFRFY